jgi:hypothetical protein
VNEIISITLRVLPSILILLCSFGSISAEPLGRQGLQHHYQVTMGLSVANDRSAESQRQLPWRQQESSALAPTRADLGLSYTWGEAAQWQFNFGLRLLRLGTNQEQSLVHPLNDPRGQGLAIGDFSVTYTPTHDRYPKLMLGQFQLGLNGSSWRHIGRFNISQLEYNIWAQEDPRWSESTSLLDRMVTGVSAHGVWLNHRQSSSLGLYRLSVATPSDHRKGLLSAQRGGILFDFAAELHRRRWTLQLNTVFAHHLGLSEETLTMVDEVLIIDTVRGNRIPLIPQSLHRNATWLTLAGRYQLTQTATYMISMFGSFEGRWTRLTQGQLNRLEVAVLSESNLLGRGSASSWGLMMHTPSTAIKKKSIRFPDQASISYLWRDPNHDFAFDERHRLLFEFMYQKELTSLIFWWKHLWSSSLNRWQLDSDIAGISLEFKR